MKLNDVLCVPGFGCNESVFITMSHTGCHRVSNELPKSEFNKIDFVIREEVPSGKRVRSNQYWIFFSDTLKSLSMIPDP